MFAPDVDGDKPRKAIPALGYLKNRETGQLARRTLYLGDGQRKILDTHADRIDDVMNPILKRLLELRENLPECISMVKHLEPLESGQMGIEDYRRIPLLRARLLSERDQAFTRAALRNERLDENSVWKHLAQFWRDKRDKMFAEQGTLVTQLPWVTSCLLCMDKLTYPWDRCCCRPEHKRSRPGRW
jgi:hypothetical protein